MNSFIVLCTMLMCVSWMMQLLEYQHYHRLTTQALIKAAHNEYELEGLLVYAETYYLRHHADLHLPAVLKAPTQHASIHITKKGDFVEIAVQLAGLRRTMIINE